jgi:hypothetical protein
MTYTVTYGNQGRMHAEGVIISTTLPLSTTSVSTDWDLADGYCFYEVGDLRAGTTESTTHLVVQHPSGTQVNAASFEAHFTISANERTGGEANPGDNAAHSFIGAPDLVVTGINVAPWPLQTNTPTVFTVTVENQGAGWAWNPDNFGGFWVDVFLSLVSPYPFDREADKGIAGAPPPLAPGGVYTQVIAHPWYSNQAPILFSAEEAATINTIYVKADNFRGRAYGLVPEYNELNNVSLTRDGKSVRQMDFLCRIYLPIIER